MTPCEYPIVWLNHVGQRLGLVPSLSGGVAAWQLEQRSGLLDLWRPWDGHTTDFPPGWDLSNGVDVYGTLVDNAFTGWAGEGVIRWPEHRLQLTTRVPTVQQAAQALGHAPGCCLL